MVQTLAKRCAWALVLAGSVPANAAASDLDEAFRSVLSCSFRNFYYSPSEQELSHPYFKNIKPLAGSAGGTYTFPVKDTLFGLPVVEVQAPGTAAFYAVTFDVSLTRARSVIKKRLGSTLPLSKAANEGKRPALVVSADRADRSVLYCSEREF